MAEPTPCAPASALARSTHLAAATSSARKSTTASSPAPAFQALLDRLEDQARALAAETRAIDDPQDLAGAVDRAHASLQDALSLSDRLVEAYREVLARPHAADAPRTGGGA